MTLKYETEYFKNLFALTAKYGTIYVTEDGNHYADKESAIRRSDDAMALRKIVRWCEIKKGAEPLDAKELYAMFFKQNEVEAEIAKKNVVVDIPLDNESAAAEFERRVAAKKASPEANKAPQMPKFPMPPTEMKVK